MFDVSESALKVLAEYLGQQKVSGVVRITPMAGNCAGPHLRLRADETRPGDSLFQRGGLTFAVDKELLAECGCIRVDYVESTSSCCCSGGCAGFRISGEKKYPFAGRCVTEPDRCDLRCVVGAPPPARSCPSEQDA